MTVLAVIEGCQVLEWLDGSVTYRARARVDDDGQGASHGDPDHQGQTSLRLNGESLNADVDRYIVASPQIINGVLPIVLGSWCSVSWNGMTVDGVVGDIGPHHRIGECSIAMLIALGIDANPNTGGIDSPVVDYKITPGIPAPGYNLQAS